MKSRLRPLARALLRAAGQVEAHLPGPTQPRWAPLFIVGPPRSGTTLVYQAICRGLRVAYPTNLLVEGGLQAAPHLYRVAATLLGRRMQPGDSSGVPAVGVARAGRDDFTSEHGRTRGPGSPHEAGALWSRWFDGDHLRPGGAQAMRTTLARIEAVFDAPFVNKNVMLVPRIETLAQALPRARFLEVRRDPAATARSIERARTRAGATTTWWSVKPSNYLELKDLPLAEQAMGQVLGVQADIAQARERVGPERFFTVQYEAFCARPRVVLAELAAWWGVEPRLDQVPERFDARG